MAVAKAAATTSIATTALYLERGKGLKTNPADRVDWIESRNLPTKDPELAARYMEATAAQNPRVENAGYHISISFHPDDTPKLDRESMVNIADDVIRRMGLQEHQTLIVAHKDRDHAHFHILTNRVHPEQLTAWERWQDHRRLETALRNIEIEHGLEYTPGWLYAHPDRPNLRPNPEQTKTSAEIRRGREAFADVLQRRGVTEQLKEATSWDDLEKRLGKHGLHLQRAGRGLQLTDGKRTAKPSRLDRHSSIGHLEERFDETYKAYRAKAPQRIPPKAQTKQKAEIPAQIERQGASGTSQPTLEQQLADSLKANGVRQQLDKLDQWDQLEEQGRSLATVRDALPYRGNTYDLQRAILQKTPESSTEWNYALAKIYRDPAAADAQIRASYAEHGRLETYRKLAENPQTFGELGKNREQRSLFAHTLARSEDRKHALETAQSISQLATQRAPDREHLKGTLKQAQDYGTQIEQNRLKLQELGKDRHDIIAELGRQAEGIPVEKLQGLRPDQINQLRSIREAEKAHLEPLRQLAQDLKPVVKQADQLKTVRHFVKTTGKFVQGKTEPEALLINRATSLFKTAPVHIVRRIAPPQVKVLLAAIQIARKIQRAAQKHTQQR